MNALIAIAARFKEASSWAGIATVLGLLGINVPAGIWQNVVLVGTGIAGLVAILVPESTSK